jgi:cyanophycin synthetase
MAGPGDRRDEDILAIADAVAGRFDHYVCRRDDSLRGRDGDEVPLMLKRRLEAQGVKPEQISLIPDEQEAIDAALRMGRPGDLLLIFADALTRSWKQVIKFRPEGAPAPRKPEAAPAPPMPEPALATGDDSALPDMEGLVRDERGVRLGREEDD